MMRRRCVITLLLLVAALCPGRTFAQSEPKPDAAEPVLQSDGAEDAAATETAKPEKALATIEQIKQQATESEQLAEEAKAEIIELCDKAVAKLTEAEAFATTTAKLQQELEKSAASLEALQASAKEPEPAAVPKRGLSAEEMRSRLSAADQQVSAAREKLQNQTAEIKRRAERRKALPELLSACREILSSLQDAPKQSTDEQQQPLINEARNLYQIARRRYREQELLSLEQENRTYEATSRLWLARRDAAEKKLQSAIKHHKVVLKQTEETQRQEAEQQARKARQSAINVHPAIQQAAAKNAALAERNQLLVSRTQQVQQSLVAARDLSEDMHDRLATVTKKADTAIYSPAIGVMLRGQQDQLPNLALFYQQMKDRPTEISQLGLALYEWDLERREVLQIDKAVAIARNEIESSGTGSMDEEVAEELRRVLEARAGILAELYSNADDCLARLAELDAAETKVINITQELASFIAEHVLWVRSDPSLSLSMAKQAANTWPGWSALLEQAGVVPNSLLADLNDHPLQWCCATLVVAILVSGRSRIRNELKVCGQFAAKPTSTLFRPTVNASFATILLAAPVPLVLGFVGWRLCLSNANLSHATGWAIVLFATVYAMLDLVRHASRTGGLGTNHFGWDQRGLASIRRACRSLQLLALPLLALAGGIEVANGETLLNTVGRLSLMAALLVIGVVSYRLFRANGPLATSFSASSKGWGDARVAMRMLVPFSILAVVGLIVASSMGYHYTAMQLTRRVFVSCVFVFACLALRSLLMRWLLVAYRRVAIQQARDKRQSLLDAQENASHETPVIEDHPQVSLNNINQQARKLVGVGAALAFVTSMWFVWGDVLPALGVFSRVELWASGLVPVDPDAGPTFISLTDVLTATGIFALTWFAGSNLPGLLEIAVLRKLPLDAGARYAASSVTRYTLVVVGTTLFMRQLGVGWQSVQWLVAAMTVGLGFGLQEIFANFVSGIILLFERPARVGDTVTIGAVTGTVTKIQIRATTILDWDSKELIVPNKDFVTGNLVNWTLTNANLRLVLKVGVAYGSDTRLTTELLYQVANANPNVLNDPEPTVIFNEFGDSSLNFELRLFVADINHYRRLRHELHLAIDDLFRLHQVEIAFPQCDLHVRTMPELAQPALGMPESKEIPISKDTAA